jgi:hypothetical protein
MARWTHDVRNITLTDWGINHSEVRPTPVIPQDGNERPEIRPTCILATGTDVGKE